jgi:hypothetical protein
MYFAFEPMLFSLYAVHILALLVPNRKCPVTKRLADLAEKIALINVADSQRYVAVWQQLINLK